MSKVNPPIPDRLRRLHVVCGDQLDSEAQAFEDFDPARDAVLMTEAAEEAAYIAQSKRRIAFFFCAMRAFADELREAGRPVIHHRITEEDAPQTLAQALTQAVRAYEPYEIVLTRPGDWRVLQSLQGAANAAQTPLRMVEDSHFFIGVEDFAAMKEGRKRFIMEDFYRAMRKRTGLLMEGGAPVGGEWNFDKENRKSFGKDGPPLTPPREEFSGNPHLADVLAAVTTRFPDAPGSLEDFDEPTTREDARAALTDFIANRLPEFGTFQDAMTAGRGTLYHSRLAAVMNVKLLDPREACAAAVQAYEDGAAPINAVEGFVRQILGWREYVRGLYWTLMPDYADLNALEADRDIPDFFWTGDTEMACLNDCLKRLLATGYAHHIERLMVMGLYLMLHGARPQAVHDWHMGLYLDAIDWVSLPNTLGMSQHGDGGVVGTKPYCASGAYIDRMSDYCGTCRYDPKQATGGKACPFTTLYWDFLARHRARFASNRRMKFQIANLDRKDPAELEAIREKARTIRGG